MPLDAVASRRRIDCAIGSSLSKAGAVHEHRASDQLARMTRKREMETLDQLPLLAIGNSLPQRTGRFAAAFEHRKLNSSIQYRRTDPRNGIGAIVEKNECAPGRHALSRMVVVCLLGAGSGGGGGIVGVAWFSAERQ
jgi:hypothetical protein